MNEDWDIFLADILVKILLYLKQMFVYLFKQIDTYYWHEMKINNHESLYFS